MAYGYMRTSMEEAFRNSAGFYKKLIEIAEEEGFTRSEAMELIKIWQLAGINSSIDRISGNY